MMREDDLMQLAQQINSTLTSIIKLSTDMMIKEIIPPEIEIDMEWKEHPFNLTISNIHDKELTMRKVR
ncbi:MAG: hypothetical protein ACTSVR_04820 [Candidatus Thorarchaeota archaeon]